MPTPFPQKELRFWHGLLGLLLGLLVMITLVFLWGYLSEVMLQLPLHVTLSVQTVMVLISFIAGALYPILRGGNAISEVMSFKKTHPLFYLLAGIGVLFAGTLSDEVASLLHRWNPDFFTLGSMEKISETIASVGTVGFVVLSLSLSLLPAVGEEMMFRGLILRSFRRDMPAHFAVIYSSILFGLVHFNWLQGTSAGLLGCYLGAVVLLSGSIFPAMLAHFINNISWCLLARYEPGFMDDVLIKGHSFLSLGVCSAVVAFSAVLMTKLRNRTR